jgi:hypothetical protein
MTTPAAQFCAACGEALSDDAEFCGSCEARVRSSPGSETQPGRSPVGGRAFLIGFAGIRDDATQEAGPGGASAATGVASASPTALPVAPTDHFEQLLALVPDTPETRTWVMMWDVERLRSHEPLPRSASDEFLARQLAQSFPTSADFGFGVDLLDQAMEAGQFPERYYAAVGRYDEGLIDRLLRDCDGCPYLPEISQHGGETFFAWGDDFYLDFDNSLAPPAFDRLGKGGRLAVVEGVLLRANWTEGMRDLIDTSQGDNSLAMDDDFRLAAQRLDALGSYTALISSDTQRRTDDVTGSAGTDPDAVTRQVWNPPEGVPVLPRYHVMGLGAGIDKSGPYIAVVLIYDFPSEARAAAPLLVARVNEVRSLVTRRHWSDLIDEVEVGVEGQVMVAKLRANVGAFDFFRRGDPLLLHE